MLSDPKQQQESLQQEQDDQELTLTFESGDCGAAAMLPSPSIHTKESNVDRSEYKRLKRLMACLGICGSFLFVCVTLYLVTTLLLHGKKMREYNRTQQQYQKPPNNSQPSNTTDDGGGLFTAAGLRKPAAFGFPSTPPSAAPSKMSLSLFPSYIPTATPTSIATYIQSTFLGSDSPSLNPTATMTEELNITEVTTFYAIGDVPYNDLQHLELIEQIQALPGDAEFLIHVGDIRHSGRNVLCQSSDYTSVAKTLRLSPVPVFIIIGDNEWNDCPNSDAALQFWQDSFRHFHRRYWNHTFDVINQPGRPDNFAFVHKQTLFVGLNIVGGYPVNNTEWSTRLSDEADWTILQIQNLLVMSQPNTPRVVIFGHADPKSRHSEFFRPLTNYIENTLHNTVPILYLCGDRHRWRHQEDYFNQPSFTRIILTGKTADPPLKVMVHATGESASNSLSAFQYDRMLPAGHPDLLSNGTTVSVSNYSSNDDDQYNEQDDLFANDDAYLAAQVSQVTIYNQTTDF